MRRIKRVWHAFGRMRHGRGFGIHSPFAFAFILRTLRERTPYYAYSLLDESRRKIKHSGGKKHHLMSGKHMRMLFRVTNHFRPGCVLILGSLQGEEFAPLLETDRTLRAIVFAPSGTPDPAATAPYAGRIEIRPDLPDSMSHDYVVVCNVDDSLLLQTEDLLRSAISNLNGREMVLVFPHMRSDAIRRLWSQARYEMPYGMTFYNEKSFGVAVIRPKLPRQDFRVSL